MNLHILLPCQQVHLLDFNPRYWTSLLGSLAAGVNFPYLSCLAALGIDFEPPTPVLRRFFTAEAAVKHVGRKCLGRSSPTITVRESGLAYAFSDPGPRAFNLAKRLTQGLAAKGSLGSVGVGTRPRFRAEALQPTGK